MTYRRVRRRGVICQTWLRGLRWRRRRAPGASAERNRGAISKARATISRKATSRGMRCTTLADGELTWAGGDYPLNHTVLAGKLLYTGDDYIMSLKTPAQVKDVAVVVAGLTRRSSTGDRRASTSPATTAKWATRALATPGTGSRTCAGSTSALRRKTATCCSRGTSSRPSSLCSGRGGAATGRT